MKLQNMYTLHSIGINCSISLYFTGILTNKTKYLVIKNYINYINYLYKQNNLLSFSRFNSNKTVN